MVRAVILLSPDTLGGASVEAPTESFEVRARRDDVVLVEFQFLPPEVTWFDTEELVYCQLDTDGEVLTVLRKATDEERKRFRVPLWIQGENVPECCGRPMFFIGQIDDDVLCTEAPIEARLWWHDGASFYVFTCPQCLRVAALGQQF